MKETGKMKTLRYILLSVAVASLASACSDDLNPDGPANKAEKGDEVRFTMTLPGADTRTIYGGETATGFPVYWVNGDLVQVCSPQCLSGRNNAEYSISVDKNKNFADKMTHTGDNGVQWGESATADFYSVYPSGAAALSMSGTDVTASLSIANAQTATPKTTNTEDLVFEPADMKNVVMIAKTAGVASGEVVNLHYVPFSTVIEFAIPGPTNAGEMGASDVIIVQTLTLTAPDGTNIAGDFDFSLGGLKNTTEADCTADLAATNVRNASNSIIVHLLDKNNAYATVKAGKTLKVKACLIPQPYTSLEGWTVTVKTNDGTYKKTIKSTDLNENAEKNKLKSGYVHKVSLPALNYKGEWNPTYANWIPELPDYTNIYLSEISLPGAWYAGSTEAYQATSDIATLWSNGVRAFAVECRSWSSSGLRSPSRVCLSGSGRNTATGAYTDPTFGSATMISSIISQVASSIKSNEYGVLVLSYADGGEGGHRDSDHAYFLAGIANEITKSGATNIYAGPIDANTTVKDVLGKLIVKVNVDKNITKGNYNSMNALISYNPFLFQMTDVDYSRPYYSDLHWSIWLDSDKSFDLVANLTGIPDADAANKFIWVFSSANRTQANDNGDTTIPTYDQRQTALGAMMTFSKTVYEKSHHNVWFYFNCGGTQATSSMSDNPSPTNFATTMNSWLLNRIKVKSGEAPTSDGNYISDPSPLGIVMFNQCTNTAYNGPAIIDAIIKMNAKFYLKHAGITGTGTGGTVSVADNDGTVTSGGSAF